MTEALITGPTVKRGRSKQDYGTPPDFIAAVVTRFGGIHLDLAATRENRKADLFFSPEDDAFDHDWNQITGNLWLNPPFADIKPWAAKCALTYGRRGFLFLLTPASIGTDWFNLDVKGFAYVLGLSPRLTFEGTTDPYPKDLMLSVYGYGLHGFDTWRWK
jgi:site-specific DNA-methyltransferase (adenine-specific)